MRSARSSFLIFLALLFATPLAAQYRKIGELDLFLRGVSATADQTEVTVPKNTMSGVRVTVRSGSSVLAPAEITRFVGGSFRIEGELSGPGLRETITLPDPDAPASPDPLLLTIPSLTAAGDYTLSNLRITANGRTALDVTPQRIPVTVIDQILVTSVTTRALTLDEIRERGIVIDNDSYLGFEFTMGITMESKPVEISFPVVFDRNGVAVPQPLEPPHAPSREAAVPLPTIVPMLLKVGEGAAEPMVRLPNGEQVEVRIPSVLVIPGNVGYLKQHFSAQLFVANGAPGSSSLTLRDVTGTIQLPKGADQVPDNADDPLTLPDTVRGPQPKTLEVNGIGADGTPNTADDVKTLTPGAQAMAEFVIRGEKEGFHNLTFDVSATLDGLATGPVTVSGVAAGGVLVRNPYFDMSFTVPAVARQNEQFKVYVTVNNISQSIANDVRVTIDAARLSGAHLVGDATQTIDTLRGRDSRTLEYTFVSERTGQVVATYLKFDTTNGTTGDLKFTLGVGERGIALSPDTLVLPSQVDSLPQSVIEAAMRVLGQAWSIANAPAGTLPSNVTGISKVVATQKALALAEAGLRVSLGQPVSAAVRDLLFDFHGGSPLDPGFDQLLRETDAGRGFAEAVGAALVQPMQNAGGPTHYERETAQLAASGPDFVTFAVSGPVDIALLSSTLSTTYGDAKVPSAVLVPIGNTTLGVIPTASTPYTLAFTATGSGSADFSVTIPRGGGAATRAWVTGFNITSGAKYRITADPRRTPLMLDIDTNSDGGYEMSQQLSSETLTPEGPRFLSATVIGPETIAGSQPFGQQLALLFDRVVDAASAAKKESYSLPSNSVHSAKRQLSGRLVFATLTQPEGPYMPSSATARNINDSRGVRGPEETVTLQSRLADIGAVVTGRIINADGSPVTSAIVTYVQNPILDCAPPLDEEAGIAATPVANDGRFEFRYVRQDQCGVPFRILTRDPSTGAVRSVTSSVRVAGEQIVMDIALFGKGTVAGTVRDLQGLPVAGASVTALSDTDAQTSGSALTDVNGKYSIAGVAVGTVRVVAAKGAGAGRAAGRLDRAGTTATIDVTLDGGSVNARGKVYRVESGVSTVIPQIPVVYSVKEGGEYLPVAVSETTTTGDYSFTGMPTGEYRVAAALNTRDRGEFTGVAAAGQTITRDVIISIPQGLATVQGIVRLPDGTPAADAVVSIDGRGILAGGDGRFTLPQVLVKPNVAQEILAATRDGLRTGRNTIIVNEPNQTLQNVVITLSGLGVVEITVTDSANNPISDQEVALLGNCNNACGCVAVKTNAQGRARFTDLSIGRITARATRTGPGYVDQTQTSVSLTRDGETAFGILAFSGVGSVAGIVLDPDNHPALGADVYLRSKVFDEDSCSLVAGVSHRVRTDESGRFSFNGVNLGNVSVTAQHPFFPTAAGESFSLSTAGQHREVTLRLTNTISGELSGTIYLPDGVTPAGAGVEVTAKGALPDVTVATDPQGHFRFAKIFPQGSYTVTASDPVTGGVAQEAIYLLAAQDVQRDLRLKGRGTVRVTVVDGAGQPVQNAFVRLAETSYPNRSYESVVAPSNLGVAIFNNVYEGPVSAEASDAFARGGRVSSVLPRPGDVIELKVAMTTTGKVRGRFLRPDGTTPIPFGIVKLIAGNRVIGQTATLGSGPSTDSIGSFSFDYVPAGPVRLEAQDPLTARTGFAVGTIATEGETLSLDVLAQGLGSVQGLITSNGAPQPGAHVEVDSGSFHASAIADAAGHYLMEGVPEGRVVVTASIDGNFLSGTASATLTGEGTVLTLDVSLRDSGTVSGVVLRHDGAPAPLSVVTVQVGGTGGGSLATTTDGQGGFTIERVPAGMATATAEVAGGSDKGRATGEVEGGQTLTLPITLNGTGIVSGRALDSAGNPTAGDLTFTGTGAFPFTYILRIGTDGAFTLRDVLAGTYTATLKTQNGGITLYGAKSGAIVADTTNDVTVQLQATGTVKGIVKRADGVTAAYGASVVIELLPNRGSITVQADNAGAFTANGIPLGALRVRVTDPLTAGIAVTPDQTLTDNGQILDVQTLVLDDTPVSVVSIDPADGATGVATDKLITIAFSDALVSTGGISLKNGASNVGFSAALGADAKSVTLSGTWPDSAELTVTVGSVTDVFGRHPAQTFSSRFRTVDLSPPAVASIVPAHNAIQVAGTATITVTFTEPLADATNIASLIALRKNGAGVAGTVAKTAPATAVFTPAAPLESESRYNVTVTGAIDASGNQQMTAFTSTFATTDSVAPLLTVISPADGGWTNAPRPTIIISVTDALSGADFATAALTLDGQAVQQTGGGSILYTPPANLADGTHAFTASIADKAGNTASVSGTFRIDTIAPGPAALTGIAANQILAGNVTIGGTATDEGSGVARIQLSADGNVFATTDGTLSVLFNTNLLGEGPHDFTARAIDQAGNIGPAGSAVRAAVDNRVLTVTVTAPANAQRFRDSVVVKASPSEGVAKVDFTLGTATLTDSTSPYEVTFDLAPHAEGPQTVTATATGPVGETASATRTFVIDRTPPPPPDATKINAEPPSDGRSLVFARAGAVESGAHVEVTNTNNGQTVAVDAGADGGFSLFINGAIDNALSIVAIDSVGNSSAATVVNIRQTSSLPPSSGTTSVRFEGLLADRVGPGAGALAPDGKMDMLITMSMNIGEDITRTLSYIDIAKDFVAGVKSTRPEVASVVGVALDAGAQLLNNANGSVAFPVTSGTTLTLFAADEGFFTPEVNYRVTAVFSDGSRFTGHFYLEEQADHPAMPHSATFLAEPATVRVAGATPGTATITVSNIRDIEGTLVPDGAKIALSADDMATKDPRGNPIRSAGGAFTDGEPAANNSKFRVYTVSAGRVVATYNSGNIAPAAVLGAHAVIQAIAADEDDNVIGTEAISTIDVDIRASTDRAVIHPSQASLYADRFDRRSRLTVAVYDTSGNPVPDGTRVIAGMSYCTSRDPGGNCINSFAQGQLIGGETWGGNRRLTVTGGKATVDYSSTGAAAAVGNVEIVRVQVLPTDAAGNQVGDRAIGVGQIQLAGGGSTEVYLSPEMTPYVFPIGPPVDITVRHAHDARANLVPDGANLHVAVAYCATRDRNGFCINSEGGTITDGIPSPSGSILRTYALGLGEVHATYSTLNVTAARTGEVKYSTVQVSTADSSSARIDDKNIATQRAIKIVGPQNAQATADPANVFGDGAVHTTTVRFTDFLDVMGNPLPEGTKLIVSANYCAARDANGFCRNSQGGQILNGTVTPNAGYKMFPITGGAIEVTYGDQDIAVPPGQTREALVVVLQAGANNEVLSQSALAGVPIAITGNTSAEGMVDPSVVHADLGDHRAMVTFTNFRDTQGRQVPDGTKVAVSAAYCAGRNPAGFCINSAGGSILNGEPATFIGPSFRLFTITNGQVVAEYTAQGVQVAQGEQIATIVVVPVSSQGNLISNTALATASLRLLAPAVASVSTDPVNVAGTGVRQLSQVTIRDLVDSDGVTPVPDGSKIALSANYCAARDNAGFCIDSAGGQILTGGTLPTDGTPSPSGAHWKVFTVTGGEVKAVFEATNIYANIGQTVISTVQVVPASLNGTVLTTRALGTAQVRQHGTTSAEASGPATLSRAAGNTAAVTFSGIKDAAGNLVPDGTMVAVGTNYCVARDPAGFCINSAGGTILDGNPSPSGTVWKVFTVTNGTVTVTYSPQGANTETTARIMLVPTQLNGTILNNRILYGGVWAIQLQ
ncbi:MAG TPA: carboxypeptidase regulatory-like domain-containing protein [Thermoanaerobaculia bacterium]|nr:carboxypeptidase regulatory-like domain-containing protein [Thermoanaerobaculia bacterium]